MMMPEILRWAAVAAITAAALRFPPTTFWSLTAGRPFVLTRATIGPGRFRAACPA